MFDYDLMREKIKKMTRDTRMYVILKEELTLLGYWKNKARGNPSIKNFGDKDARKKK